MTDKTITGWLIVDWKNETHRTRKSKPNASELGANEMVSKLKVDVTVPEVEVPTLKAKIDVPKPQVHAAELETLDGDELPNWTNIADEMIDARSEDVIEAETVADYESLVMEIVANVMLDAPGMANPETVEEYVHTAVLDVADDSDGN